MTHRYRVILYLLVALFLIGCSQPQERTPLPPAAHYPTPTYTPPPTPTPEVIEGPITLALPQQLSEEYATPLLGGLMQLKNLAAAGDPVWGGITVEVLDRPDNATTTVGWRALAADQARIAERFFAVVVPFATVTDNIALETLQMRWQGQEDGPVLVTDDTARQLRPVLGEGNSGNIQVVDRQLLLPTLQSNPAALAIVPFDQLDPGLKVLAIDTVAADTAPADTVTADTVTADTVTADTVTADTVTADTVTLDTVNEEDSAAPENTPEPPDTAENTAEDSAEDTVIAHNVLSNQLEAEGYPLAVALVVEGEGAGSIAARLLGSIVPYTNRDPAQLTTLIMTGVTAMSRGTADAIERTHLTYPADVISATLRAGDIVHVSNEVPFLDDCQVNNTLNNLVLCSHTDYWAVLEAIDTDIVGLSGNHVNDFGRDGARRSLQFYRENEIAHYGSGLDVEEACEPLFWEHNGNTFAFLAVIAFGPETAWATEDQPGACHFYDRVDEIHTKVEELAQEVDIVAVELQYYEHYDARPTAQQVAEFRELRAHGAQIVTGVQSHVPQAWEPYSTFDAGGPGIILYGLGNLFFDQMWSWETRTGLIARHTVYQGRVISTEILTTVLEDFAQPRWTDPAERAALLQQIFNAAPPRE